jgi:hypothetical protein
LILRVIELTAPLFHRISKLVERVTEERHFGSALGALARVLLDERADSADEAFRNL